MHQILGWLLSFKLGYDGILHHLFWFHNSLPIQRPMIRTADGMSLNNDESLIMRIPKACVESITDVWWQMTATFMQKEVQTVALLSALFCLIAKFLVTSFASLFFTLTEDTWKQTRRFWVSAVRRNKYVSQR